MIPTPSVQQHGVQGSGTQVFHPASSTPRKRIARTLLLVALLIGLVSSSIGVASVFSQAGYQLRVRIGNQQSTLVDLRQHVKTSPDLLGTNVFPAAGTSSLDQTDSGFMNYGPMITNGLRSAHVKLLRFPGGEWGEKHSYSLDQLDAFSTLLNQTSGDGMIQAQLTTPLNGQASNLAARASRAGLVVDYMNHQTSIQRTGTHKQATFHPVALWTVGNEPDLLINPDTGLKYTVNDYMKAFIQFSNAMHQNDPTIKVFGPEISQFYGVGNGPVDAQGTLWMEGFLKGVSDYERQHPGVHLLDGISFHRYQFDNARQSAGLLLSSPNEWDYTLPALRQLIRQDFGRDLPIALTEVNTNPNDAVPSRTAAATWWADTLGHLLSQQVEYVAFFSTEGVDTPYPLFSTKSLQETPMLRVMQLFAHLQSDFVPVQEQQDPVSMYATQDTTGQSVSLLFVNKSDNTQVVQVNTESGLLPISPWQAQTVSLRPNSIIVLTLHRNGGDEAYSYTTPGTIATPLLLHTLCGNKNYTLSNVLPC